MWNYLTLGIIALIHKYMRSSTFLFSYNFPELFFQF